jgi:phenylalanine-4-hydroxylase
LPSVAGGPADPETWDRWFGELDSLAQGDGEARAHAEKVRVLDPDLAALYEEVRELRERGSATRERLQAILDHASRWPGDWLLRSEVEELLKGPVGSAPPRSYRADRVTKERRPEHPASAKPAV